MGRAGGFFARAGTLLVDTARPLVDEIDRLGARARHILALDVGQRTGWARSDGTCGTKALGLSLDGSERADIGATSAAFHDWLMAALLDDPADLLLVERPFGRSAFVSDLPLVLCGVAHLVGHRLCVDRRELTASAIKKAITGNGRAKKAAVLAGVRLEGWQPDSDHAADAAALIIAWRNKTGAPVS